MGKAIRHFFSHNIVLKTVSFIASLLLWVIVVNLQDPIYTDTINNIPIQILNETYFNEHGQIVTIESDLKLNVTVSGNRSVVERATAEDFRATIDFLAASAEEGRVKIQVTSSDRKLSITQQSASYVKLHIQDIVTKEFPIRVETVGDPASVYLVATEQSEMLVQPSAVSVRGPQEWVDQIVEAVVVLNMEGAREDVSGRGKEIELRNAAGEVMSIEDEEKITMSSRMMTQLVVPVYKKFSIKLNPQVEMTDPSLIIDSVSITPSSIVVYGNELKLSPVTSIDIPQSVFIKEEGLITQSIDVKALCRDLSGRISGVVGILSEEEAVLKINVVKKTQTSFTMDQETSIRLLNKGKDYEYEILYPEKEITVTGPKNEIDALKLQNIQFEVDVTDCKEEQVMDLDLVIKVPPKVSILSAPSQIQVIKHSKLPVTSVSEAPEDSAAENSQTENTKVEDSKTVVTSAANSNSQVSQAEESKNESSKTESSKPEESSVKKG